MLENFSHWTVTPSAVYSPPVHPTTINLWLFLAVPARNASTLIQCSSREYYYNVVVEYTATVQSKQC